MITNPTQVLFIPQHSSSLMELLPVAECLQADGRFRPLFFLYRPVGNAALEALSERKIPAIGPHTRLVKEQKDHLATSPPSLFTRVSKSIQRWLPITFILDSLRYLALRRRAKGLLKEQNIQAIVTIGDRHVGWETALIRDGHLAGIPTLIAPYAMSDPDVSAIYRIRQLDKHPEYIASGWLVEIWLRKFPDWAFEFNGQRLLFLPLGSMLAAQLTGIMPSKPWSLGGGSADRMTVENQVLKGLFEYQGVASQKLVVTGKPSVDQIYRTLHDVDFATLLAEHGFTNDRPVITCAVPHLGEHELLPFDEHMQEIESLFAILAEVPSAQVLLSLHPKSNPAEYEALAGLYGAVISQRRVYELLPVSTVFVAGFSSTVMNAIGVHIPTVVVDFYGLDHHFFDGAPGVQILKDKDRLVQVLCELLENPEHYQAQQKEQIDQADDWVLLDGQCTRRVVDNLYDLIDMQDAGR